MDDLERIRSFRLNDATPSAIARAAARERLLAHIAEAPRPIAVPDTADGLIAAIDGGTAPPETLVPTCVDVECEPDRGNDCHAAGSPPSQLNSATSINRITLALCVVLAAACVTIAGALLTGQPEGTDNVRASASASGEALVARGRTNPNDGKLASSATAAASRRPTRWKGGGVWIAYRRPAHQNEGKFVSWEGGGVWIAYRRPAHQNEGKLVSWEGKDVWIAYRRPARQNVWTYDREVINARARVGAQRDADGQLLVVRLPY